MDFFWDFLKSVLKMIRGVLAFLILVFILVVSYSVYMTFHVINAASNGQDPFPSHATAAVNATSSAPPSSAAPPPQAASGGSQPQPSERPPTAPSADPNNPISVTVTHIAPVSESVSSAASVAVTMMLKNNGTKEIRALKGALIVYDPFGSQVMRLDVKSAKTIKPGKSIRESGEWNILFDSKAQTAVSGSGADVSKLTFAFDPSQILYADGSKSQF